VWSLQPKVAAVSAVCDLFHEWLARPMMNISSRDWHIKGDVHHRNRRRNIMNFRWTDWLAAVAVVVALGAFAAAETSDEAPLTIAAR
jgi:hypothetical protein